MPDDLTYTKQLLNIDILETISEKFDDAVEMMGGLGVVFGGAVRDTLANFPLLGDIDILIPNSYVNTIKEIFIRSTKWVPDCSDLNEKLTRYNVRKLESILTYKNSYGATAQLIVPKGYTDKEALRECNQKKNNSLTIEDKLIYTLLPYIKTSDIICCGVFMLDDGTVFEALDGAYDDCLNKRLRLNPLIINADLNLSALENRIKSLQERGWTSEINLDELKEEVFLLIEENRKRSKDTLSKYVHTNNIDEFIMSKLKESIYTPLKVRFYGDPLVAGEKVVKLLIKIPFTNAEICNYFVDKGRFIDIFNYREKKSNDIIHVSEFMFNDAENSCSLNLIYNLKHPIDKTEHPFLCDSYSLDQVMSIISIHLLSEFIKPITAPKTDDAVYESADIASEVITNSSIGEPEISISTIVPGRSFMVHAYKRRGPLSDELLYRIKIEIEQSLKATHRNIVCTIFNDIHFTNDEVQIRLDLVNYDKTGTGLVTADWLYPIIYKAFNYKALNKYKPKFRVQTNKQVASQKYTF